jgi:hypothetical protein
MKILLQRLPTLIILAAYIASPVQSTTQAFTLSLEAEETVIKANSEVRMNVTIRNTSNRAMYVSDSNGPVPCDYLIDARDSQGRQALDTDLARNLKLKKQGYFDSTFIFTLQPGESHKTALVVTRLYDLSRPGKYLIQVSREVPKELGGGTIKSNVVTVTISQ